MVDVGEAAAGQPNFSGSSERNAWRTTSGPKINHSSAYPSFLLWLYYVYKYIFRIVQNRVHYSLLPLLPLITVINYDLYYPSRLSWLVSSLLSSDHHDFIIFMNIIWVWLKVPPNLMVHHPILFLGSQLGLSVLFSNALRITWKSSKIPLVHGQK